MIPKYYTFIVVSCIKAPLIKNHVLVLLVHGSICAVGGKPHLPQGQSLQHALFLLRHQSHPSWYACQAHLLFHSLRSEDMLGPVLEKARF